MRGSARSSRSSPKPSSRGIITSVRIRSGGRSPCRRQRRLAVRHGLDPVLLGQQPGDVLPHVGVVVGHQHAGPVVVRPARRAATGVGSASWSVGSSERPSSVPAVVGEPPQRLLDVRGWPRSPVEAAVRPSPIWSGGRWADPSGTVTVNVVPSPDVALGGDRAAVQPDQLLHQRQPDAAALVGPAPRVLDPVEPLEQPGHLLGGDARAGVPHPQLGGVAGLPQRDGDLALEGELEGVGERG